MAVKIIKGEGSSDVFQEMHSLKELNHPNIVKLFEVITTDYQVYLFMEHACTGMLHDYIEKSGPLYQRRKLKPHSVKYSQLSIIITKGI